MVDLSTAEYHVTRRSITAEYRHCQSPPSCRVVFGEQRGYGFAYCSALITSMPTNRSFPSTHASCPGGTVYESPATMFFCVPSFIRIVRHPETAYPTCEAWQDSVLTTGFMHSDQRQPGSRFKRLRVNPSKRTTSTRVLFGVRTSSGDWCDFTSNPAYPVDCQSCYRMMPLATIEHLVSRC